MSRQSKEVQIGEKKITIYELTVRDLKQLWKDLTGATPETTELPLFSNEQILQTHWDKCIHGMKLQETEDLAPSELKLIYDAFAEVNSLFFDLSLKLEGDNPFLKGLRAAIVNDFILRCAALSPVATEKSGTTDTVSS